MFEILLARPRILNVLHYLKIADASSQTTEHERQMIAHYASGAGLALEIGAYQGASSVYIAGALGAEGRLWCIDPWPEEPGRGNPCYSVFKRHVERAGVADKIVLVRKQSGEAAEDLPEEFDFAFIDGDHSWNGVDIDWKLVSPRIRRGGHICLHDSLVPPHEPSRSALDSIRYFEEIIKPDERFELVASVHSLVVLRKL